MSKMICFPLFVGSIHDTSSKLERCYAEIDVIIGEPVDRAILRNLIQSSILPSWEAAELIKAQLLSGVSWDRIKQNNVNKIPTGIFTYIVY
jgi:hypothetical protein